MSLRSLFVLELGWSILGGGPVHFQMRLFARRRLHLRLISIISSVQIKRAARRNFGLKNSIFFGSLTEMTSREFHFSSDFGPFFLGQL